MEDLEMMEFYKGKRVLVTGHTGFKGTWLCRLLKQAGAIVTGYSLAPRQAPNLFVLSDGETGLESVIGDIRDLPKLRAAFTGARPEILFHLAAQPLVSAGFEDPVTTYETNVMGTVHVLECVRETGFVKSVVNVTTDKVYENREWPWGYREDDRLDGKDPYANSKSCSEMVMNCYGRSWLMGRGIAISSVRAGNVIGGGDFAENRIIPDCVRAAGTGRTIMIRNRDSVRPYQHVLEPLTAYLEIGKRQWENPGLMGSYNVGPAADDAVSTARLADLFCHSWGGGACWQEQTVRDSRSHSPKESVLLRLDCGKLRDALGVVPVWSVGKAVDKTVEWAKAWLSGEDVGAVMDRQIAEFFHDREAVG